MTQVTDEVIETIGRTIVRTAHPEKIILFGSRARGEGKEYSDIDLIVVESEPFSATRSRRKEMTRIEMELRDWAVPLDLLLYSRDEVVRWGGGPEPCPGEGVTRGKGHL